MKEVIVPADDLVCIGKKKLQEVIRCKECKHSSRVSVYLFCLHRKFIGITTEDFFCAGAERKEECSQ